MTVDLVDTETVIIIRLQILYFLRFTFQLWAADNLFILDIIPKLHFVNFIIVLSFDAQVEGISENEEKSSVKVYWKPMFI